MKLGASKSASCRASVLIIVLWVSLGLVATALYFAHSMVLELKAADNNVASMEADQAIEGAALYVSNILATRANMMMIPTPDLFHAAAVKVGNAKFWLIGRDTNDLQTSAQADHPVWGLVDEASRINLNSPLATASNLQNLPQMTQNTAAAMYDWQSGSTTPSANGAKSETYSALNPPYLCKSSNYDTPEELRMVYGLNMDLLYGEDANLNGILDPNENDGMTLPALRQPGWNSRPLACWNTSRSGATNRLWAQMVRRAFRWRTPPVFRLLFRKTTPRFRSTFLVPPVGVVARARAAAVVVVALAAAAVPPAALALRPRPTPACFNCTSRAECRKASSNKSSRSS